MAIKSAIALIKVGNARDYVSGLLITWKVGGFAEHTHARDTGWVSWYWYCVDTILADVHDVLSYFEV